MGMFTYMKNKLSRDKDVPAAEQFYTPLRIALHSTISLNTVDLLLLTEQMNPNFSLPSSDLSVLAIGSFEMDGNTIWQVYTEDSSEEEFIIRIVEGKEYRTGDPTVEEVNLFKQVYSEAPETEDGLNRILSGIGFDQLELEGHAYDRLWGDQWTQKLDFRTFTETVVTPQETAIYTDNYILYGRSITDMVGKEYTESLIVGIEEDDDQAQIIMQAGLSLNINDIEVQ